jgi:hypothetical protein
LYSGGTCDDGDACTADACDPVLGCVHVKSSPCKPKCTGSWHAGRCFHARANGTSWQAAFDSCKAEGRQLASVHSVADNAAVLDLVAAEAPGKSAINIGWHSPTNDANKFAWTDGTALDFKFWGYPNGIPTKATPAYVKTDTGLWLSTGGATTGIGSSAFVCEGL